MKTGTNLTLSDATYENRFFYDLMIESFQEIDFLGLMGNSRFNSHGETHGMINIEQRLGLQKIDNYYIYSLNINCISYQKFHLIPIYIPKF